MYLNEAERANWDIYHVYDNFQLNKNTLVSMVYTKIFQRFKG